jgi:hypothetical protein
VTLLSASKVGEEFANEVGSESETESSDTADEGTEEFAREIKELV